jgi:hypothetical protein
MADLRPRATAQQCCNSPDCCGQKRNKNHCCKGGSATALQQSVAQQPQQSCNTDATSRNSAATAPFLPRATAQQPPIGVAKLLRPTLRALTRIPEHPAKHPPACGSGRSGLVACRHDRASSATEARQIAVDAHIVRAARDAGTGKHPISSTTQNRHFNTSGIVTSGCNRLFVGVSRAPEASGNSRRSSAGHAADRAGLTINVTPNESSEDDHH